MNKWIYNVYIMDIKGLFSLLMIVHGPEAGVRIA